MDVVILWVCCRSWIENTRLDVPQWAKLLVLPVKVLVGRCLIVWWVLIHVAFFFGPSGVVFRGRLLVSLITIYRGTPLLGQVIFCGNCICKLPKLET